MSERESISTTEEEKRVGPSSAASETGDRRLGGDLNITDVVKAEGAKENEEKEGGADEVNDEVENEETFPPLKNLAKPDDGELLFDVVLVHGLHGDQEKSWADAGSQDGRATWLKEGLCGRLSGARLSSFGYSLEISHHHKSRITAIRDIAIRLIDQVYDLRKNDPKEKFYPIAFLTHDIGGIIAKEALRIAVMERGKYNWLQSCTRSLIFFGCPHRCARQGGMADQLLPLLFKNKSPRFGSRVDHIIALGEGIEHLNDFFIALQPFLAVRIVNVYSTQDTDQIFDQAMATTGLPYEIAFASSKCHDELCRLTSTDTIYKKIKQGLSGSSSAKFQTEVQTQEWWQAMCFDVPPLHPSQWQPRSQNPFSWVMKHSSLRPWLEPSGRGLLYMHGSNSTKLAAEYLVSHLQNTHRADNPEKHTILSFTFNKYDIRLNTAVAMLISLVWQVLRENPDPHLFWFIEILFRRMLLFRGYTASEWLHFLTSIITYSSAKTMWCIISNVDQCQGSLAHFVESIKWLSSVNECSFKFALIGDTSDDDHDDSLQNALLEWLHIDLEDVPEEITGDVDTNNRELEIQHLMRQYPYLAGLSSSLKTKVLDSGKDLDWRQFVLGWLNCQGMTEENDKVHKTISLLSSEVEYIIIVTLEGVRDEHRGWARTVLSWVAYAFRPLTVWELSRVLSQLHPESDLSRSLPKSLHNVLNGLVVVKYHEVHWAHLQVRNVIVTAPPDSWYSVEHATMHETISQTCLTYLSSKNILQVGAKAMQFSEKDVCNNRLTNSDMNLAEYAAFFWPEHLKLTPLECEPREKARELLQDSNTSRWLALAHWKASNMITRTDRGFISVLPFVAGLGLEDIVEKYMIAAPQSRQEVNTLASAMGEAARNRHLHVLRRLLQQCCSLDEAQRQDLLWAATSAASEEILNEVVTHTIQTTTKGPFDWPAYVLCRAVNLNSHSLVVKVLNAGADVDAKLPPINGGTFTTAAHWSAAQGHLDILKLLLERKADFMIKDQEGNQALDLAALNGHAEAAKVLVDAGADINARDSNEITPLYLASVYGYRNIVQTFVNYPRLEIGNDLEGHWSPLTAAVDAGFYDCVRILLENGADPNLKGSGDSSALQFAVAKGHDNIVRLLLEKGARPYVDNSDYVPLAEAATAGKLGLVKLLVDAGHPVDVGGDNNRTPLLKAAEAGHLEVAEYLISKGAKVTHLDKDNMSALHLAASLGHADIIRVLCDHGADLNQISDKGGWAPLHLAYNSPNAAKALLEKGADINLVVFNWTTLALAASEDQIETVKVMLDFGPNLEVLYDDYPYQGYTALSCAVSKGNVGPTRLILEAGANVNHRSTKLISPLHVAVLADHPELVRMLMEFRPNLECVDSEGDTPLMCINDETKVETIKPLIKAGANLEATNKKGYTALLCAVVAKNLEVTKYLLSRKAQVNIVGGFHGGPLHYACLQSTPEIVRTLVTAGADINIVDTQQRAPMHLAASNSIEHLQLILEQGANIEARDAAGRTLLHWAILSGSVAVVERVLTLSQQQLTVADDDGWTPLLWAARGWTRDNRSTISSTQQEIISLLVNRGADPCVHCSAMGKVWSTAKLARYYGMSDSVIKLLEDWYREGLAKHDRSAEWDELLHSSKPASERSAWCDGCFIDVLGYRYDCKTCPDFAFCSKCYQTRHLTHLDHEFSCTSAEEEFVSDPPDEDSQGDTSSADGSDDEESGSE